MADAVEDPGRLWLRWVAANGVAEFVGLTSTMALAAGAFAVNDRVALPVALLMALGVAVLGGAVEGLAVGYAQWRVLRDPLPALRVRDWALATAIGAGVAWALGMLPSTLLSAASAAHAAGAAPDASAAAAGAGPPLWLQLVLAAGMGAVLGPFLGVPQWRVLRRHLPRAGWWVLANVTAWMLGMPAIFLATGLMPDGASPPVIAAYVAAGCLLAGVVVGAVHGAWLLWLLRGAAGTTASARAARP